MQQEPNPKSFTPQAPSVNSLNRDNRVNPAAAQPQRPQAPPTRPSGPAVHIGNHQPRVPPPHIHYGQPAPQYNYGHQGRRPVPAQQAPGYYAHLSNVTPSPALNPYAQNFMNAASNFGVPNYNNFSYRGPSHVPQPSIGTAQAMQSREFQSAAVPQQNRVSSAVHPPPRKSKAIKIVNPETNEEVKISKAKDHEAKVIPKVSPPVRKPLEVVPPSDKVEKLRISAPKSAQEKSAAAATPVVKTDLPVMKTDVAMSPENVTVAAKAEEEAAENVEDLVKPVEKASAPVTTDKELPVSDVTEKKTEPSAKRTELSADSESVKTSAVEKTSENESIGNDEIKQNPAAREETVKSSLNSVPAEVKTEIVSSGNVPNKEENLSEKPTADAKKVEVLSENIDSVPTQTKSPSGSAPSSPRKRSRPQSPIWTEGSRRTYDLTFLMDMRDFTEDSRVEEYALILTQFNVSKNQLIVRDDVGTRRAGGKYSSDPRGKVNLEVSRGAGAYGVMPEFDLRGARNNRPPPDSRGRSSNYDSRGRSQDGGRRGQGPVRGGHGPLDRYQDLGPVEKLKKSDNHWQRNKEKDSELEAKVKLTRSLLNKITLEKFDKITGQILAIELNSPDEAQAVVAEIFEKTLFEPKFANMYAMLCKRLDGSTKAMFEKTNYLDKNGKQMTFRKVLLKFCQTEFQKSKDEYQDILLKDENEAKKESQGEAESEKPSENAAEKAKTTKEADSEERIKAKRRSLANIRFIGELYTFDLISEGIIHKNCIQPLLSIGIKTKEEETLEAFVKLMRGVGKKVTTTDDGRRLVGEYFKRIVNLAQDYSLPARIRFFLQDLVELRQNRWKPRIEEAGAKTIAEIHKEIEEEQRAKAEQAQVNRNRGGRGSGSGSRERRGGSYSSTPSTHMTMAAPRTSRNTSRANAVLERYGNLRSLSGDVKNARTLSGDYKAVRLGPGSGWTQAGGSTRSRLSVTKLNSTGSSSQSLRPQSSGRFSALESVPTEASIVSTGDTRRGGKASATVGSTGSSSATAVKNPMLKSDEEVKKKARSLMTEYWDTENEQELKECVKEEVGIVNGLKFTEFSIREALNAKISLRNKGVPYFKILLNESLVDRQSIIAAFTTIVSELNNITVDDPRAPEFVARYLAGLYSTGKLGSDGKTGLEFLTSALTNTSGKIPVKFILVLLSEMSTMWKESGEEAEPIKKKVLDVFNAIRFDMVVAILSFNAMRGIGALEDMLKEYSLEYLCPALNVDKVLVTDILNDAPGQKMLDNLKALDVKVDLESNEFASQVVTRSLAVYFSLVADKIQNKMINGPGALLKLVHKAESLPKKIQMSALFSIQPMLYVIGKAEFPLPLAAEYEKEKLTHGYVAFDALYEADIVEENAFMEWKADESDKAISIGGKPEVLLMTASWYAWLANAETESS